MLTYELFSYARTGMMSGMARGAFNGKARMQWAVYLVCKAIFPLHSATRRRCVGLHKPLAMNSVGSRLCSFHMLR